VGRARRGRNESEGGSALARLKRVRHEEERGGKWGAGVRTAVVVRARWERESSWREGMDLTGGSYMVERDGGRKGAVCWALAQEEGEGGMGREELGQAEMREGEGIPFYFSNKFSKPFSI